MAIREMKTKKHIAKALKDNDQTIHLANEPYSENFLLFMQTENKYWKPSKDDFGPNPVEQFNVTRKVEKVEFTEHILQENISPLVNAIVQKEPSPQRFRNFYSVPDKQL